MMRCQITGNLCGTDTWKVGSPCSCGPCRTYIEALTGPALVERLRRKALYGIGSGEFYNDILVEAADRIEALEAALREAWNALDTNQLDRAMGIIRAALSPSGNGEGTT
jgi:hypothetical protein